MSTRRTTQDIRKQARERAVAAAASRERSARERFEELRAKQRAQSKANEDDLAVFFGAEASIADAEERLATAKRLGTIAMADAAQAIVSREGSVRSAAHLLGVPVGKVSSLTKAAKASRSEAAVAETLRLNTTPAGESLENGHASETEARATGEGIDRPIELPS